MFRQTVGLGKIARWRSLRWPSPDRRSSTGSPLARDAVDFALRRHAGQVRDGDEAPFALHPLEVGALLSFARYSDYVVAAGVLHDVLEDTATDENELTARFGPDVTALVRAVSDDPSIDEKQARKAALRSRVAHGPNEARAVFAADKVSKARELRLALSCAWPVEDTDDRLSHYRASLSMLEVSLGYRDPLVEQLRFELEALEAFPPA